MDGRQRSNNTQQPPATPTASAVSPATPQAGLGQPTPQTSTMMQWATTGSGGGVASPWGGAEQQQWPVSQAGQHYAAMPPPPPSASQQFQNFNFASNNYESFAAARPGQRSLPSPNMNHHQFLGLNGNPPPGPTLGYNLAVNTAMHAARPGQIQASPRAAASLAGQGNCQPGYPVRPSESRDNITSNLLSCNVANSDGHPGQPKRTDYSPDTTTKDISPGGPQPPSYPQEVSSPVYTQLNMSAAAPGGQHHEQPSFLAYKAGDVPVTGPVFSAPMGPAKATQAKAVPAAKKPRKRKKRPLASTAPAATSPSPQEGHQRATTPYNLRQRQPISYFTPEEPPPLEEEEYKFEPEADYGPIDYANLPAIPGMDAEAIEKLRNNQKPEAPACTCFADPKDEPNSGPYYTQLGVANSLPELRSIMEKRCEVMGNALRIEKARYCVTEGKSPQGCPIAKNVIRRKSQHEKYLVIAKHRTGHRCINQWIVIGIVAWEGVRKDLADSIYDELRHKLSKHGYATQRQCDMNTPHTCACQGLNEAKGGSSFSFGCSWSMYFNVCKYARSHSESVRKFKLSDTLQEKEMGHNLQVLATEVSPLYARLAPHSYQNMTAFEAVSQDCRIGLQPGKPFSGVTAVADFCAHAHKDRHNMNAGCTVVVTLTKPENRPLGVQPDDEQLHVLPHYAVDSTDEFGSVEGQRLKAIKGGVEILDRFERTMFIRRAAKKKRCKRGRPLGDRKRFLDQFHKTSKEMKLEVTQGPSEVISHAVKATNAAMEAMPKAGKKRGRPAKSDSNPKKARKPKEPKGQQPQSQPSQGHQPQGQPLQGHQPQGQPLQGHQPQGQPFQGHQPQGQPLQGQQPQGQPPTSSVYQQFQPQGYQQQPSQGHQQPLQYQDSYMNWVFGQQTALDFPNASWSNGPISQLDGSTDYPPMTQPQQTLQYPHQANYYYQPQPDLHMMYYNQQQHPEWPQGFPMPPTPQSIEPSPTTSPIKAGPSQDANATTEEEVDLCDQVVMQDTDCNENFGPDKTHIGGLAIALPHGSVLFECAKHELHATTALKQPNRAGPTRIGLVFYQHKNLNYPHHGHYAFKEFMKRKNARDYEAWKEGKFVPTPHKLADMRAAGYRFPDNVRTVKPGTKLKFEDIEPPDLSFLDGDFTPVSTTGVKQGTPVEAKVKVEVKQEQFEQKQVQQHPHLQPYHGVRQPQLVQHQPSVQQQRGQLLQGVQHV